MSNTLHSSFSGIDGSGLSFFHLVLLWKCSESGNSHKPTAKMEQTLTLCCIYLIKNRKWNFIDVELFSHMNAWSLGHSCLYINPTLSGTLSPVFLCKPPLLAASNLACWRFSLLELCSVFICLSSVCLPPWACQPVRELDVALFLMNHLRVQRGWRKREAGEQNSSLF